VIRGEQDRGVVILLERRFQQYGYARHLPTYWNPEYCKDVHTLEQSLRLFWEDQDGAD
jgi:Rad3-related DNA helicase